MYYNNALQVLAVWGRVILLFKWRSGWCPERGGDGIILKYQIFFHEKIYYLSRIESKLILSRSFFWGGLPWKIPKTKKTWVGGFRLYTTELHTGGGGRICCCLSDTQCPQVVVLRVLSDTLLAWVLYSAMPGSSYLLSVGRLQSTCYQACTSPRWLTLYLAQSLFITEQSIRVMSCEHNSHPLKRYNPCRTDLTYMLHVLSAPAVCVARCRCQGNRLAHFSFKAIITNLWMVNLFRYSV